MMWSIYKDTAYILTLVNLQYNQLIIWGHMYISANFLTVFNDKILSSKIYSRIHESTQEFMKALGHFHKEFESLAT